MSKLRKGYPVDDMWIARTHRSLKHDSLAPCYSLLASLVRHFRVEVGA